MQPIDNTYSIRRYWQRIDCLELSMQHRVLGIAVLEQTSEDGVSAAAGYTHSGSGQKLSSSLEMYQKLLSDDKPTLRPHEIEEVSKAVQDTYSRYTKLDIITLTRKGRRYTIDSDPTKIDKPG